MLTVAHVLRGDEVAVTFADGRTAEGRVAGTDPDLDVAVIAVDTGETAAGHLGARRHAAAGCARSSPSPTPAAAGCAPRSGSSPPPVAASAARAGRRVAGSIEHTAPLPRGSSGGPLVDPGGNLLGLNAVRRDGGFILALPADRRPAPPRRRAGARRGDRSGRGWASRWRRRGSRAACARRSGCPSVTGCSCAAWSTAAAARAASSAAISSIRAGDRPLTSMDDLFDALDQAGDTLALGVVRGSEERELEIALK